MVFPCLRASPRTGAMPGSRRPAMSVSPRRPCVHLGGERRLGALGFVQVFYELTRAGSCDEPALVSGS